MKPTFHLKIKCIIIIIIIIDTNIDVSYFRIITFVSIIFRTNLNSYY